MINSQKIIKPNITEKSLNDAISGVYTFTVKTDASKGEVKREVEELFPVHVEKITTVIIHGKKRMVGRKRQIVKRPDIKKARVKLAPGEKIDLFETGEGK